MTRALTPEEQERRDHWARVHVEGDKQRPVSLGKRLREDIGHRLGMPTRRERGNRKPWE